MKKLNIPLSIIPYKKNNYLENLNSLIEKISILIWISEQFKLEV